MIPVVDIFAGPGGLGEGFASMGKPDGPKPFKIALSIENDKAAHSTLELRSFFRQFRFSEVPPLYYCHLRGEFDREELFNLYSAEAAQAKTEAWLATLDSEPWRNVHKRVKSAVGNAMPWVLIGGPPCQAYSTVGRSRNKGISDYKPEEDERHYLYKAYLRIIAKHWPPVFVMENVKGLLSATVRNERIFENMVRDLESPKTAIRVSNGGGYKYRIYSLEEPVHLKDAEYDLRNFLVKAERHGVPQARHRLFLLGVREDLACLPLTLQRSETVPASAVLDGLPRLRSGLSQEEDSPEKWKDVVLSALRAEWMSELCQNGGEDIYNRVKSSLNKFGIPREGKGSDSFLEHVAVAKWRPEWFSDSQLLGVCNHGTRLHMRKDLHRYLFAACFAKARKRSPALRHFPVSLLPMHKNVSKALDTGCFADRFRVQLWGEPSTTVTSHIAKDGHYYIHPDPTQCRSLTVREAARLQTFPDNYMFCGTRTDQYRQVGNAVPPLLAAQIAEVVLDVFKQAKMVQ